MYHITKMLDGQWKCDGMLQDGWEDWFEPTRKKAVQSMIKFARVMNGTYITEKDMSFMEEKPKPAEVVSNEDSDLLKRIKSGHLKVLPFDDPRIKYNITEKECDLIVEVREGDAVIRRVK